MRLAGRIERRLLINYRAAPEVVAPLLPAGLRPQLVDGSAVVGLCLLRLDRLRPVGAPRWSGLRSENVAHRMAVTWDGPEGPVDGVFIPRRDSDAAVNVVAGGRAWPGVHGRADVTVAEAPGSWDVAFAARRGDLAVRVRAERAGSLGGRLFPDTAAAARFFTAGRVGLSPSRDGRRLEGVELCATGGVIEPVSVVRAESTWFDDPRRFPPGSVELDCGLVMAGLDVIWRPASQPPAIGVSRWRWRKPSVRSQASAAAAGS